MDENENTIISKRTQKGIWHNLYEFPLLETSSPESDETVLALIQNQVFVDNEIVEVQLYNPEIIRHKLSHQHLHIKFWKVGVKGKLSSGMDWESVKKLPFPIVLYNFIENI